MSIEDQPVLLLKFAGEDLSGRSVPIYNLGTTLVSIQRIIYWTAASEKSRLGNGNWLTAEERQALALQISKHSKSSDLYALVRFSTDPDTAPYFLTILKIALQTLASYSIIEIQRRKSDRRSDAKSSQSKDVKNANTTDAYLKDVGQIVGNININVHNTYIDKIEITGSSEMQVPTIIFTTDTKKYLKNVQLKRMRRNKL